MKYQLKKSELFFASFYIVLCEAWKKRIVRLLFRGFLLLAAVSVFLLGNTETLKILIPFFLFLLVRTGTEYRRRSQEGALSPVQMTIEENVLRIVSNTTYECPFSRIAGIREYMGLLFIVWLSLDQEHFIILPVRIFPDMAGKIRFIRRLREAETYEGPLKHETVPEYEFLTGHLRITCRENDIFRCFGAVCRVVLHQNLPLQICLCLPPLLPWTAGCWLQLFPVSAAGTAFTERELFISESLSSVF